MPTARTVVATPLVPEPMAHAQPPTGDGAPTGATQTRRVSHAPSEQLAPLSHVALTVSNMQGG